MHVFNNNYIISIILFLILFPFIININVREMFNNNILTEEVISEEIIPDSYLHLTPSLNYLDKYKDVVTENSNITSNSVNNLVSGRNDVYLQGKPMTSFDSLNYNRAFIDGLKYQNLEDRYIYKLNQKVQY